MNLQVDCRAQTLSCIKNGLNWIVAGTRDQKVDNTHQLPLRGMPRTEEVSRYHIGNMRCLTDVGRFVLHESDPHSQYQIQTVWKYAITAESLTLDP